MAELMAAWLAAEVDGWEVVGLVRHRSAPADRRWNGQLVRAGRRVIGWGPRPASALVAARVQALRS